MLEVSEAIASSATSPLRGHDSRALHSLSIDFLHSFSMTPFAIHAPSFLDRVYTNEGSRSETPVEGHPSGWVWQTQQAYVVSDVMKKPPTRNLSIVFATLAFVLWPFSSDYCAASPRRDGFWTHGRQGITAIGPAIHATRRQPGPVAVDNGFELRTSQAYQKQLSQET